MREKLHQYSEIEQSTYPNKDSVRRAVWGMYQKALKFIQRMFYSNKRPWRRGPSDMYMSFVALDASTPVAKEREEEGVPSDNTR